MSAVAQQNNSRLQQVQAMLESGALQRSGVLLNALTAAEIPHLFESLPLTEREILWGLVGDQDGEVLVDISDEVSADLIKKMDTAELLAAADGLDLDDLDDLADLIQNLPATLTTQLLDSLDSQRRKRLESVLSYPEDTAGVLMDVDTVTKRPEVSLDSVLRFLRTLGEHVPENTDALIVVNRDDYYL